MTLKRQLLLALAIAGLFAACTKSDTPAPAPAEAGVAASTPASTGNAAVDYTRGLQTAVDRAKDAADKANKANQTQQAELPKE